jgi:hypothetical protein
MQSAGYSCIYCKQWNQVVLPCQPQENQRKLTETPNSDSNPEVIVTIVTEKKEQVLKLKIATACANPGCRLEEVHVLNFVIFFSQLPIQFTFCCFPLYQKLDDDDGNYDNLLGTAIYVFGQCEAKNRVKLDSLMMKAIRKGQTEFLQDEPLNL